MIITNEQICWIAGILEGEGSFQFTNPMKGVTPSIRVRFNMLDKDIVYRVANILGFGSISKGLWRESGLKQPYYWECSGVNAAGLMMTIYSLMGERRKTKIKELLTHYKSTRPCYRKPRIRKVFMESLDVAIKDYEKQLGD